MRLDRHALVIVAVTLMVASPTLGLSQDNPQGENSPDHPKSKYLEATSKGKDSLVTDRPDFTESSSTPPPGRLQLESGVRYTHQDRPVDDTDQLSVPNTLLRYGLSDLAELRVGVPDVIVQGLGDDEQETTFGELSLGAKFATALSKKVRVGLLPTVGVAVDSGDVSAEVRLTGAVDITKNFSLSSNLGARTFEDSQDDRRWEGLASLAPSYSLTDDLSTYVEGYTLVPEDGDTHVFVDGGFLYLVTHWVQLDAFVGAEVRDGDTLFGGLGVSVLF